MTTTTPATRRIARLHDRCRQYVMMPVFMMPVFDKPAVPCHICMTRGIVALSPEDHITRGVTSIRTESGAQLSEM